jgi:IS30 family transposase
MDFITDLPESNGCTNILVITDRLIKDIILKEIASTTSKKVAWTLVQTVIRQHGLPKAITSDRDTQFVSEVWRRVYSLLKICQRLSTAYHPQTNGATEHANSIVEAYLHMYVAYD